MKILIDGFFQWIAFDTSNFRFFGSGGGSYKLNMKIILKRRIYRKIQFFSRDNNKVGLYYLLNMIVEEKIGITKD